MRLAITLSAILLAGCASTPLDPKIDMQPPAYVEELPPQAPKNNLSNQGSLFGKGDSPLFSDRKARHVNDIVTVFISETTTQSSSASNKLSDSNQDTLGGGILSNPGNSSTLSSAINKINKYTNIGFETQSSSEFSGSGSNSRNDSFNTSISARIIKVLNNGNYFIEGSRELLINGNKQIIQISGVIRPDDISQHNQIDSKYIADAKIKYTTQGDIDRATKKPYGSSIFKVLWPF